MRPRRGLLAGFAAAALAAAPAAHAGEPGWEPLADIGAGSGAVRYVTADDAVAVWNEDDALDPVGVIHVAHLLPGAKVGGAQNLPGKPFAGVVRFDTNGNGTAAIAWEDNGIHVALRTPGSHAFGSPALLALPPGAGAIEVDVSVNSRGDVLLAWPQSPGDHLWGRIRPAGGTWGAPFDISKEKVDSAYNSGYDVALGGNGEVVAVAAAYGCGHLGCPGSVPKPWDLRAWTGRPAAGFAKESLADPDRTNIGPRITVGDDGGAILLWDSLPAGWCCDQPRPFMTSVRAAGGAFGAPRELSPGDGIYNYADTGIDADGRGLIAYGDRGLAVLPVDTRGATFGTAQRIGLGGGADTIAVSPSGQVLALWSGSSDPYGVHGVAQIRWGTTSGDWGPIRDIACREWTGTDDTGGSPPQYWPQQVDIGRSGTGLLGWPNLEFGGLSQDDRLGASRTSAALPPERAGCPYGSPVDPLTHPTAAPGPTRADGMAPPSQSAAGSPPPAPVVARRATLGRRALVVSLKRVRTQRIRAWGTVKVRGARSAVALRPVERRTTGSTARLTLRLVRTIPARRRAVARVVVEAIDAAGRTSRRTAVLRLRSAR